MSAKYIIIQPNISPYSEPHDSISEYITLSQGIRCCTSYGIARLADHLNPPVGTDKNFAGVSLDSRTITFELSVELPETLSSPAEDIEDWIENVRLDTGEVIKVALSNQLAFYYHWVDDSPFVALSRRISAGKIRKGEHSSGCAPRLAHTVACVRKTLYSDNVYRSICEHVAGMQDSLIEAVQKISLAHLQIDRPHKRSSYPIYDRSVFEHAYLGMFGADNTVATTQLWINPNKSALQSALDSREDAEKISNLLTDGFDSNDANLVLLPLAKASLSAGVTHYAFIAAFIYAETLCSSVCKHQILRKGVSTSKYSRSSRDLTSSIAINILLKSLFDSPPPDHIIKTLDASRKLRNDLMHDGSMVIGATEVRNLIDAAEKLKSWADAKVFDATGK